MKGLLQLYYSLAIYSVWGRNGASQHKKAWFSENFIHIVTS